jgi:hypothetical protein
MIYFLVGLYVISAPAALMVWFLSIRVVISLTARIAWCAFLLVLSPICLALLIAVFAYDHFAPGEKGW